MGKAPKQQIVGVYGPYPYGRRASVMPDWQQAIQNNWVDPDHIMIQLEVTRSDKGYTATSTIYADSEEEDLVTQKEKSGLSKAQIKHKIDLFEGWYAPEGADLEPASPSDSMSGGQS